MSWKKIAGIIGFLIIVLLLTVYAVLATYDYNNLKPHVARMVKNATGRELHLGGDIKLSIGLSPSLVVTDAALANASWGSQPQMIKIEELQAHVHLLPLLFKEVNLKHIGLKGVDVLLETDSKGQGNWQYTGSDRPQKSAEIADPIQLNINNIVIGKLKLAFRSGKTGSIKQLSLVRLHMARQETGDILALDLKSEYNGQPITLTGTIGSIDRLLAHQRFPLMLSGKLANSDITVDGAIEDVLSFRGVDLTLKASGNELADLAPLVGGKMPPSGAFKVNGHLKGSAKALALSKFSAEIDKSDFKGQGRIEFHQKPKITLRLESSVVDFTSLMQSLENDKTPMPSEANEGKRRLFPDTPLHFDNLTKVNADIVLKADNIHAKDARFQFGHISMKLEDHDFNIDKFEATYKETKISGELHVKHDTPAEVSTGFMVQNFDLGGFLKETGVSDQVRANIDIAANLQSEGDSVRNLMAHLNGSIGAVMGEGYLTKYLDMLSVNLTEKVLSFWGEQNREQAEQIKCAVVQFDIKDGVATSEAFVFDSQALVLTGLGETNLGTEQVNFLLMPNPKKPALFKLPVKLRVSGTIMDPQVKADKLTILKKGGEAAGALAVGPLGLLAPFVHTGAHKAHPCNIESIGQLGLETLSGK